MTPRSFIRPDEEKVLHLTDRRFSASGMRWWVVFLVVVAALLIVGVIALELCESKARSLATDATSMQVMLSKDAPGHRLTGAQATVHVRYQFAIALIWAIVVTALVSAMARLEKGHVLSFWRTIKHRREALTSNSGPNSIGGPSMIGRPPIRGRKRRGFPWRFALFGSPMLSAEKRWEWYRMARGSKKDRLAEGVFSVGVMILFGVAAVGLVSLSVWDAAKTEQHWYSYYMSVMLGYDPSGVYLAGHLYAVDLATWALCSLPCAVSLVVLGIAHVRRLRLEPRLIGEMRRLDVMIWRKANNRLVP